MKRRWENTAQAVEEEGEREGHDSESPVRKKTKEKKRKKSRKESTEASCEPEIGSEKRKDGVKGSLQSTPHESGTLAGRHFTVSIALPGSIVDNAQTLELKTYLAGQIARAAAVFCIDEIVVFDEKGKPSPQSAQRNKTDPNMFLARLLQYQETPQYLRKTLFPMDPDLKFAGLLNPLDCPHHMRIDDISEYREGVVIEQPDKHGAKPRAKHKTGGSTVNCGMRRTVQIDKELTIGTRVTVKLHTHTTQKPHHHMGEVVSPSAPRTQAGIYWGYHVRLASSFSSVFTQSPYKGGYDLTIGTSERGESIDGLTRLPSFRHLLVVFGGLKGLEYSLECDDELNIGDVSLLFHHYLNTCPRQGSRTIRTEEAILVSLSALRPLIWKNVAPEKPQALK